MKKVLGIITSIFLLSTSASQLHAAALESWNYTLSNIQLSEINTDFGYKYESNFVDKHGITYHAGGYAHSIEPKHDKDVSGQHTTPSIGVNNVGNDVLLRYDTSLKQTTDSGTSTKIANLSFTYSIDFAGNGTNSLSLTYTLPLYSYYDATTETSYVYFADNEVSTTGKTTYTDGNNLYVALGFNLYVDGRALSQQTDANGVTYSGWAINADTRNNTYDSYVVGENNTSTGEKYWKGSFDITSDFYMLSYPLVTGAALEQPMFKATYLNENTAAPTPEPATMLLMGIGLAALGFSVRSKNK